MERIAFAASSEYPMSDDDALAARLVRAAGVEVEGPAWDDPSVDWGRYSLVVIRSTWNYHRAPDRYADWLRQFLPYSGRMWNPSEVVLDNIDKHYLLSLAVRGVEIVPSAVRPAGEGEGLRAILRRNGWGEAVVKPTVSAGAVGAWRAKPTEADETRFAGQARTQALLVQPFVPEVAEAGEWSLVYFWGEYSHAVRKRPGEGDFRTQQHLGGSTKAGRPSAALIEQGRAILGLVGQPLLYARVDGIERDGRLLLMELEINEPFLFLEYDPAAARRFADALLVALRGGPMRER
jgi:glutathione synthase/RimK-type ligase-like ATP-grasp enzyme